MPVVVHSSLGWRWLQPLSRPTSGEMPARPSPRPRSQSPELGSAFVGVECAARVFAATARRRRGKTDQARDIELTSGSVAGTRRAASRREWTELAAAGLALVN